MEFTVRLAATDDDGAISAIDRATWSPDNTPSGEPAPDHSFLSQLAPWHDLLVAERGSEIAGWVIVGGEFPPEHLAGAHTWSLRGLAVLPVYQGQGGGRTLLDRAVEHARAGGATRVRSRVLSTNSISLRLHHRMGFQVEGVFRGEFRIRESRVDDVQFAMSLETRSARPKPDSGDLRFVPMTDDRLDEFVEVLTSCRWEHFGRVEHTQESARGLWEGGSHWSPDAATSLIELPAGNVIGFVRLFDLEDPVPLFDIRLKEEARGCGHGRAALAWITRELTEVLGFDSVEAHTNADNLPMRATLRACGYVKEAHHRSNDPSRPDSTAYRMLKRDWESGVSTPVPWFDEF